MVLAISILIVHPGKRLHAVFPAVDHEHRLGGPNPGRKLALRWPWTAEPFGHVVIVDGKETGADQRALQAIFARLVAKAVGMPNGHHPLSADFGQLGSSARASGDIFQRDALPSCAHVANACGQHGDDAGRGPGGGSAIGRTAQNGPPQSRSRPAWRVRSAMPRASMRRLTTMGRFGLQEPDAQPPQPGLLPRSFFDRWIRTGGCNSSDRPLAATATSNW